MWVEEREIDRRDGPAIGMDNRMQQATAERDSGHFEGA